MKPLLLLPLVLLIAGCGQRNQTVADAFPPKALATPWILTEGVWSGTFAAARPALGAEADAWQRFDATHAWIAKYCHQRQPERCLTVRLFAFPSAAAAQAAFDHFRPEELKPFDAGDAGTWTEFGVFFRWGRLVCDVFGPRPILDDQLQAGLLAGFLVDRMPASVPHDPR